MRSISTQVKLTVIAVNTKRIAALVDNLGQVKSKVTRLILRIEAFFSNSKNPYRARPQNLLKIPTFSVVSNNPLS